MSRRRKRQTPVSLDGMSQAKRREFAFFPPRIDSSTGVLCHETTSEIAAGSATTEACGEELLPSTSKKDAECSRREIAWKVPVVTSALDRVWLRIGVIRVGFEEQRSITLAGTGGLHVGWTVDGELFVQAGAGETAVWLTGRPEDARVHLALQSGSAESIYHLVERQTLVQLCLVDEGLQSVTLGVSVSKRLLDASLEYPRATARLIAEHVEKVVQALYPMVTWPGQLSISPSDAKKPPACLSVTERIQQLYREAQQRRLQLCLHGAMGFNPATIPGLTAVLRVYQMDAVCWMVEREGFPVPQEKGRSELHPMWVELPSFAMPSEATSSLTTPPVGTLSKNIYFCPHTGRFSLRHPKPSWPRGGILADEMGLGKTVEVLALILSHKWKGCGREGVTIGPDSWEMEGEEGEEMREVGTSTELTTAVTQNSPEDVAGDVEASRDVQHQTQHSSDRGAISEHPAIHPSSGTAGTTFSSLLEDPEARIPFTLGTVIRASLEDTGHPESVTSVTNGSVPSGMGTNGGVLSSMDTNGGVTSGMDTNEEDIVRCVCGAVNEGSYRGEFVQCEVCLLWQHSSCVGFKSSKTKQYICTMCRKNDEEAHKGAVDPINCMCGAVSWKATKGSVVSVTSAIQCTVCQQLHHSQCIDYKPKEGDSFVCINCLLEKPLFAKSTLIVVPESIAPQWREEIIKHTQPGTLRVLRYVGVSEEYVSPQQLASYDVVLATYESLRKEIYHVNSHKFTHILRHKKRYTSPPSPLPAVHWWRVCLDEAQMVESTHASAAEMMQRIKATNRWCVTGTPIQHDLTDLHGLFLFLGAEPYCQINWFNLAIWYPYCRGDREPAVTLLSNLMWRNNKQDVAKELNIPEQSEKVHWLTFGPLETYFYGREQETCAAEASKMLACLPSNTHSLSNLLHSTVVKVMAPLHRLRKACCHPQVVRGGYLLGGKGSLTMPQLLKKLILQAKQEGREALRQLVSALNGLAAMHIIKNECGEAIGRYREAMTSWLEHDNHLECDKLQRIHTMENLAELLRAGHTDGTHTLRDSELEQGAAELRAKYAEKAEQLVTSAINEMESLRYEIEEAKSKADLLCAEYEQEATGISPLAGNSGGITDPSGTVITRPESAHMGTEVAGGGELGGADGAHTAAFVERIDPDVPSGSGGAESQLSSGASIELHNGEGAHPSSVSVDGVTMATWDSTTTRSKHKSKFQKRIWWVPLIDWAMDRQKASDLLKVIKDDLAGHPDRDSFYLNFTDIFGLQYVLYSLLEKLQDSRNVAQTSLEHLIPSPLFALLAAANECHLKRGVPRAAKKCQLCIADGFVVQYERLLFAGYQAGEGVDGRLGAGGGEGGRSPGLLEKLLRSLLHFAKVKRAPEGLIAAGKSYLDVFDGLKKEYEVMRSLSTALDKRLCVHDELRMAASRYRMATELELTVWVDDPLVVKPAEVAYRMASFCAELEAARSSLKRCLGQIVYLQGLSQSEGVQHPTKEEVCPVCMCSFGDKWGMFPCGHPLCVECVVEMVRKGGGGHHSLGEPSNVRVQCPLCRLHTMSESISYVQQQEEVFLGGNDVQGEWSTKVTAVVSVLLNIQAQERGAKSLVFSSWYEVLGIISQALKANGIRFVLVDSKHNFQTNLALFKKSPDVNVLLMPIYAGSKGLNIVEATNVLLVEPMLNTGAELQAIGRVHRMGQTRPTTVHRFYVKHTVEERIYHLFSNSSDRAKHIISNESETSLSLSEIQELFHV